MMSPSPAKTFDAETTSTPNKSKPTFLLTSEPSTPPDPNKSQCSSLSDGESFECYGENDLMSSTSAIEPPTTSTNGVDLELMAPHIHDLDRNSMLRHSWARTSLRGIRGSGKKQMKSSSALANHLYRSSSFNSSGRSSNCDNTEDMYSDVSLEDVQDLNHKLEILQRQVITLADTQINVEDRTSKAKTDYAVLQARYHCLEEQLRETELRAEERALEEQKRYRELLARVEREAQLKSENSQIRLQTMEIEMNTLRDEIQRLRAICDKQTADLSASEDKLENSRYNLSRAQESLAEARANERRYNADKVATNQLLNELQNEIEKLRSERMIIPSQHRVNGLYNASSLSLESTGSSEPFKVDELHREIAELKQMNRSLEESNEELQAMLLTKGFEEGRNLLNGGSSTSNLADELKEMGQAQDLEALHSLSQLQIAYQEKEDECKRLKRYIDTILLNIVENYPQLLEIKTCS